MKVLLRNIIFVVLVLLIVMFIANKGWRGLRVSTPSIPRVPAEVKKLPGSSGDAHQAQRGQLSSMAGSMGVRIMKWQPQGGGVHVTLSWSAGGGTNKGQQFLSEARRRKVIRGFSPAGSNAIDVRQGGEKTVYIGRYDINF